MGMAIIEDDCVRNPVYLSEMVHGDVVIQFTKCAPNIWWRFWQFVFFGIRWRSLEGKNK